MAAIRAHYSTAIGAYGPDYGQGMGSWFLDNYPGLVESEHWACLGMVQNLPHWPPYWAQVWGDVWLRQLALDNPDGYTNPGAGTVTSNVELVLGCCQYSEITPPSYDGYFIMGEVHMESFAVLGTAWQRFEIPVRELLIGNPIKESDMWDANYDGINYDSGQYWYGPLSFWWYNQTYFPWLRVNSGPSIEVKILRLWDQVTCATDQWPDSLGDF